MRALIVIVFILFINAVAAQTPNWQWAKGYGGNASDDILGIATDNTGNSYICGNFYSSTISIGANTLVSKGNFDFFVAKFDNSGNPLWVKGFGGIYDDTPLSIAIDASGNSYVTGFFVSPTLVCGSYTLTNSGFDDLFLMKFDANGNLQWAKNFGNGGSNEGKGITTDASGNIFVTGFFNNPTLTLGTYTLTGNGNDDCFVSKFDSNGNVIWAFNVGDNLSDCGNDIASDASGNIFVTGYFKSGSISAGTYTLNNNTTASADLFVLKCSNNGTILAANSAGDMFDEIGTNIAIDASGNALITGYFFGTTLAINSSTLTSYGGKDFLLVKCNNNCNFLWAKNGGGMYDDYGNAISSDASGNIYVNGHNHSPVATFGTSTINVSGIGGDGFIAAYNATGSVLWAYGTGGGTDDGWDCLSLDGAGNIYAGGFFTSSSVTIGSNTLNTNGNADMMLAKINSSNGIVENMKREDELVNVFPNPSSGMIYIKNNVFPDEIAMFLYDSQGKAIMETKTSSQLQQLDLYSMPKGIYYLRYISKNKTQAVKFILN